jgi:uncharacterized membrane protein
MRDPLRHHSHRHLEGAFGSDRFGQLAERFARFFGTPQFIIAQTIIVAIWIGINALAVALRWDPYPFILLNLMFSTQAAYAAPLILLAQTRQADRDKAATAASAAHRQEEFDRLARLQEENTELTERVHELTARVHGLLRRHHSDPEDGTTTSDDSANGW